jgi:4a-hydroxytetrahydrobiopterin dehydratase
MAVERITAEEAGRRLTKLAIGVIGPGLPRRRRDQWILLYGAAKTIEPGVTLDEKSLNEKLKAWLATLGPHTSLDHVTVRRALVDESFVERSPDGATYRRSRAHERWVVFEEVAMPNVSNALASERCTACRGDEPRLNESEIAELALGVKDWMVVQEDDMLRLRREFTFRDFAQALAFTNQVGALAEKEGHHPALLTEWGKVTVSWWTHKIHGLHRNDFVMAAKTDLLAS